MKRSGSKLLSLTLAAMLTLQPLANVTVLAAADAEEHAYSMTENETLAADDSEYGDDFDDNLRLSELPALYIPMVDIVAHSEAEANLVESLGLDVIRFHFDRFSDVWYYRAILQPADRAAIIDNNLDYTIIQDCIVVRFDWWDNDLAPAPRAFVGPLPGIPGIPGHPNTTGRPDLTVDPAAVFDPAGVSMHARFGFPHRTGYRTVTEYYAEMNFLAKTFPEVVQLHVMGYSHEGNPIIALEISNAPGVDDGRPNSVHNAGAHAREWPANEFAMNLAWYLITQYGTNERITDILDTTRVWLLPLMNPDGMHWDQRNAPGSWRKNRRDNSDFLAPGATLTAAQWGVDLNRNYPYDFVLGEFNLAAETFRGPGPASEPEIQALLEVYLNNHVITDITGHTFGRFNIFQDGTHPNNDDLWILAYELYRRTQMAEDPTGAANAAGQSVGWLFNTANTMSILTEYGHHGFVRPFMGEPAVSRFGAVAPYNDYHGSPRRIPLTYRHTAIPGNSGAPTADITAPVAFLDTSLYLHNGVLRPLTFDVNRGNSGGMQATVARVNELGEQGGLEGRILMTIQAANANASRDVVLAAQNHGALAVIFTGGNAAGTGWASTDYFVGFNTSTGQTGQLAGVNFNVNLVGTTAEANAINIPVASTYRMAVREFHEWVRNGGTNTLTLTSTPADDPANAHLYPVIPGSMLAQWYQYVPAFLHVIEASHRFSPVISGTIVCEDGELLAGASLESRVDVNNRIRQGTTFNAAGAATAFTILPPGTFVQTRNARMDSEDGTFAWSVTPSVQPNFENGGYTITAIPPQYSGRYSAETAVVVEFYGQRVNDLEFVLESAITVNYDAISVEGDAVTVPFATTNAYTLDNLAVTLNGTALADAQLTALSDREFHVQFSLAEFGRNVKLVIALEDTPVLAAAYGAELIFPAVTGVRVTGSPLQLQRGRQAQLTAAVVPVNAADSAVTWTTSNPAILTVNEAGLITGVSVGSAIVTATTRDGGFRSTTIVRVM